MQRCPILRFRTYELLCFQTHNNVPILPTHMQSRSKSTVPPILQDPERRQVIPNHELGLHVIEASLEAQDVLQGVVFELRSCFVARLPLQQVLDELVLRRSGEWPSPDRSQHFRTTVVCSHRHHRLHQSELGIV